MGQPNLHSISKQVQKLGADWHEGGSFPNAVLEEFFRISEAKPLKRTLETGCGRSTLLFSHLSGHHEVFALGPNAKAGGGATDDSYLRVVASPLLAAETVTFVLGPTQRTLPTHQFNEPFDLVLLDGPHAFPFVELEYYFVYPHIKPGGYLVIDDICIPTIYNLFTFLLEDDMFRMEKVIQNTAFFTRTDSPLFDPCGDNWPAQKYNKMRFPIHYHPLTPMARLRQTVGWFLPTGLKRWLQRTFDL